MGFCTRRRWGFCGEGCELGGLIPEMGRSSVAPVQNLRWRNDRFLAGDRSIVIGELGRRKKTRKRKRGTAVLRLRHEWRKFGYWGNEMDIQGQARKAEVLRKLHTSGRILILANA